MKLIIGVFSTETVDNALRWWGKNRESMRSDDAAHYYRTTRSVRIVLWCGVGLLVTIGMVAALGRGLFVADFATRAEPFRQQLLP